MKYIDEVELKNKRILVRVDFNVSLNPDHSIANDVRIRQTIPTLKYLLDNHNKLILLAHLGEPKGRDENFSLKVILPDLQKLLPNVHIGFVDDILNNRIASNPAPDGTGSNPIPDSRSSATSQSNNTVIEQFNNNDILLIENIRFFPGETENDPEFAKQLASFADAYVNDAFAVSHRKHASVVGIPQFLPSYSGLLLKKEITMLKKTTEHPQKPFVAILSGNKISTKIRLIGKLIEVADHILLAGGLAHNFLLAKGVQIGKSIVEESELEHTRYLIRLANEKHTEIVLPIDAVVQGGEVKNVHMLSADDQIFDIGPETQAHFGGLILRAKTIIWNGPVGKFEDPAFKRGTDFIYYAITENSQATSIIGGGETLSAMSQKAHLEKITHISTGGGAMLEFIENGTLPGIEALQ